MSPIPMDWSEPPAHGIPEGTHFMEVRSCELKYSKKSGDPMLHVTYEVIDGDAQGQTLDEYMMLAGKARGIGQQQLMALGFDKGAQFEASELIGRRVYAAIKHEESTYKGQTRKQARVDNRAEGSMCGLWPESEPPASAGSPVLFDDDPPKKKQAPSDDDSVPF